MPALFLFLFKVNIALVLFCLGYYLVLRHLTFYTLNRVYLVIAILFSTLYLNINLAGFINRHQQLTRPVQTAILRWKLPAENLVKPLYQPDYWQWIGLIFWAGVALFAIRLMMQLVSLYKLYRQSKPGQVNDCPVRLIRDDISPFSFWRSIYINPAKLSPAELKNVLEHEQVHVSQWHTMDILLAELSTIFYWFNPGVWLMKKAVRENIEFITDRKILQKGTDSKQYQYSLLSVSLATVSNPIVNHFNISTIKKRIIMMNTKRSSGYSLTRYVFLIPVVIILLLAFSLSKAEVSKKGMHTIKLVAAAISNAAATIADKPHTVSINHAKPALLKKINLTGDTIYSGKTKDGKKSFMVMSDVNSDSANYVINGMKSTKAAMTALDPAKINSIEILNAKNAKPFYPELDNGKQVVFVTTDDSETGKQLKEKMDKAMGGPVVAKAKTLAANIISDLPDVAPAAESTRIAYSTNKSGDDAPVVTEDNGKTISTVIVTNVPNADPIRIKTSTNVKKTIYFTGQPKIALTVRSSDNDAPQVLTEEINEVRASGDNVKTVYLNKKGNDELTIDSKGQPLFIIDGKEAKSIKNLAPADIKSVTVLKGEAAEKQYGAKGKNGVVVITTKKGK